MRIDTTQSLISLGTRQNNNCIIIRYEDLVQSPKDTLLSLFEYLGVNADIEQLLENTFSNREQLGFSDHKSYQSSSIHDKSVSKWLALPQQQVSKFASRLNPLLEICGYDLIQEEENDLAINRRMYLNGLMIN